MLHEENNHHPPSVNNANSNNPEPIVQYSTGNIAISHLMLKSIQCLAFLLY